MTPERWQRIESLVEAALEHSQADRMRFVDAECGSDSELHRQVAALLESYDRVDSFMETPAALGLAAAGGRHARAAPALRPGVLGEQTTIGRYRLLDEIGHGGMGSVYLAAREDGEYQHRVAIKLIRPEVGSESIARRFRSERQILANLDHPNIARLLDGGTADNGRPYVVMELIEGTRIDVYCDRRRSSIRGRIELFGQVCAAVAYAHRNLVVHRDLKPGNILVTGDGVPKLLDFGIAKLLDPAAFPHTVESTHSGLGPMTPPYASPEQILGRTITTASDVYSLGVLLYKLLTGRLPFEGGLSAGIRDRLAPEASRPSTAVTRPAGDSSDAGSEAVELSYRRRLSPQQLRRRLAGDLDNIVLKALRREPERRYSSVEQLAADLKRHLDGLPVLARRASLRYRAGKFLRRHRLAVAAAATALALIVGSSVVVALQAVQISRQRDLAEQQRDRAERVSDTLVDLFETFDPNENTANSITVREILDRGVEDVAVELQDQPLTQAAAQTAIGKVYRNLGLYDQARPLLEDALDKRRELLGDEHPELAESQYELAALYSIQGDRRAEGLHQRALEIRRKLLGPDHADVARSLLGLGAHHVHMHRPNQAIPYLRQALDIGEQSLEPIETASILEEIADAYRWREEPEIAAAFFERSLKVLESALGPEHPRLAYSLPAFAWTHCEKGDFARGQSLARRALEIQEKHLGPEHPDLTDALGSLAYCNSSRGNYDQALTLMSRAADIAHAAFGPASRVFSTWTHNLGIIHLRRGDYELAEQLLLKSLAVQEGLDLRDPSLPFTLNLLGRLYTKLGQPDVAIDYYRRTIAISGSLMSEDPQDRISPISNAMSLVGLGEIHRNQGRYEEAQEAYAAGEALLEPIETIRPITLFTRAVALTHLGRADEARPIIEDLLRRGWQHPDFLRLSRELGYAPDLPDE